MSMKDYPDVLNVKQVCQILNLGKSSVYKLLNKGEIKYRKIGNKFRIPKVCVIDYLDSIRYTDFAQ